MNYDAYFPHFLTVWLKFGIEEFRITPWSSCELVKIGPLKPVVYLGE